MASHPVQKLRLRRAFRAFCGGDRLWGKGKTARAVRFMLVMRTIEPAVPLEQKMFLRGRLESGDWFDFVLESFAATKEAGAKARATSPPPKHVL